ncbi:T9SS type A sorting domain-containing protein [Dyadobacter sp. LHD-138]|uniref:T9SS type A sorting domain-containing protein n=1 Tax=Dyadobacter sp. LHD-138 TaxID=3071413 RepID=UPI0027DF0B19|nr:T9SS type A sorting domain-containing protein [Dyadobacter sp. LHD-138]MDQ6482134.1 T9SS type A sorting domain-containing protein [Dyadobacter sp. LHD-138]
MRRNLQVAAFTLASAMLACFGARAQTPGGVAPAAWYRADGSGSVFSDAGTTVAANNATVQQWNEAQGSGYNLLQASVGARPVFSNSSTLANFNPTVTFDGSNDFLQFTAGTGVNVIDRTNGAIYTAGYVSTMKQSGFAGFNATMDYPGLHIFGSNNKLLFFTGGPGYQGLSASAMTANTFFTAGSGWENGAGTNASYAAATVSLNGTRTDYNGSQLLNANLSTGARDFRIGADNNYGAFSGQLNEVLVYENKLTSDQLDRVETYLAIKYGSTYAVGIRDYKSSTGAVVWSASTNTGLGNNIAGIGRDDAGALHQKQSWSTNAGAQVLIGTGTLSNTNTGNGAALTNGQFLIWGDNGLAKSPNVVISGISGISHRFASIWKVQNTGSVGAVRVAWAKNFTNLSLIQSTDNVINSSDVVTNMAANETTINGVVYNYADVTLTDGQYFTFAAKVAAPGGVNTDLRVWLKSDNGFTPAQWNDNSGNINNYTQTNAGRQPFTAATTYNFNPVIDFGTTGADARFMVVPAGKPYSANGTNSSIFTVNLDRGLGGYADILGFGATTTTANLIEANSPVVTRLGTNVINYPYTDSNPALPAVAANKLYLNDVSFTVGVAGIKYGQNGTTGSNTQTFAAVYAKHADGSILGSQPQDRNGLIGEVIAYERDLTEAEKQRVRTYTAVKYGITLPHNYIASDGTTVIWNQTTNTGYSKNIAGITSDEGSALVQKQSQSINSGSQVVIGTTGLAASNASNNNVLPNGQSLVWGDNGLGKVPAVAISGVSGVNFRFASVWKVQNTSGVGTVRVAWPAGLTNLTLVQGSDPAFASVASSTLMTSNTVSLNGVSYNYADVTLANGQYFTFATQLNGPGGVALNLRVWLRSDAGFTPDSWADLSGNANNYTQTNESRQPFTASKLYNFNPMVDFGTTGADARFMVVPSGKPYSANGTSSTIFSATTSKAPSGYTDIIGFGATTTGTGFAAADLPAFTKLNNNIVLYPYPTAPALPSVVLNRLYLDDVSYTVATPGIKYGQNGQTATVNQTFAAGLALHANGSVLGAQAEVRNGNIGELIAYERDLAEPEKQRVRSYVAIKYGITLPHNYIAANGTTTFWDQTTNTGYNKNIAGIARDDYGSLSQKQSWSINTSNEVLISTTGLADDNASNATMLTDQQFLVWGDNGLGKAPTISLGTIAGLPYNRFSAIWKVQNTGSVGTVRVAWVKGYANLKLVQSTDNVIDLSDAVTEMSSTVTIGGKEYAYADVTLANGSFFTFAAFVQGPGGVTNNLNYWYRADKLVGATVEDADVDDWTDFTSGTTISQLGDNDLPKFKPGNSAYFNFNPGLNYTAGAQTLGNTNVQTVTALNFDIYTLTKEGLASGGGNSRVFSSLVDNITTTGGIRHWDGIGLNQNGTLERVNTTRGQTYFANPGNINYAAGNSSIMYNTFTNTTAAKGLNGAANGTTATYAVNGQMTGGHAIGSTVFSGNGSDNAGFVGNIGEVIVYGNGNNTPAERNKVESYLAIKYGLTLHNSNNYTTSKDIVVWDATANAGYYTNVAGIGNDILSALNQKQSRSQHTNTNNQVTIGLGGIAATNDANTSQLTDGQFLVWGDNGNTQAMTNTASTYTAFVYSGSINNARRMNRIWKVQNANVTSDVLVRFPVASVGTTMLANDACAGYVIVFASDAAFSSNVTSTPLTVNGTDYEAVHSFPAGASYFTFAKVTPITTGTVYLPAVVEQTTQYNDNCGTGEWTYFRKTDDNSLKFFAASNIAPAVLNGLTVKVTPEGVTYEDGTKTTRLMPRITTVTDASATPFTSGKVRVYYAASELAATQVSGAQVSGWFKYEGTADEVLGNVYSSGSLDGTKTTQLTPDATGVEDGVNYVEFHNLSSFSSFIYLSTTSANPLPVTLTYFNAAKEERVASLKWGTTEEVNNRGFEIQRSADARAWHTLGFVENQTGGNSKGALSYNFTDATPLAGTNYYRLKQIDWDDAFRYSSIAAVKFESDKGSLFVYPNPVVNGSLSLNLPRSGSHKVSVLNISGLEVLSLRNSGVTLDVKSLPAGVYVLKVVYEGGDVYSKTFVVK